jgi:hypothetical protein
MRSWVAAAFPLLIVACNGSARPVSPRADPALAHGEPVPLPVPGEFPRLGLRWTYRVVAEQLGDGIPRRIAYQLTGRNAAGHPWVGWWLYQDESEMEWTGATIEPDSVFFHPPRLGAFRVLEMAPWPIARPGAKSRSMSTLTLGKGWGKDEGRSVQKTMEDVGFRAVSVPAGEFKEAWYVRGWSEGWQAEFHWVDRVGFVRMWFRADDGRGLEMSLEDVRFVRGS